MDEYIDPSVEIMKSVDKQNTKKALYNFFKDTEYEEDIDIIADAVVKEIWEEENDKD